MNYALCSENGLWTLDQSCSWGPGEADQGETAPFQSRPVERIDQPLHFESKSLSGICSLWREREGSCGTQTACKIRRGEHSNIRQAYTSVAT